MDEAYLRRIAYKIAIPNPSRDQLAEITRRYCRIKGIEWSEEGVVYLMDRLFEGDVSPHGCFPRDIITTVIDEAEFTGHAPALDRESIDTACASISVTATCWASLPRRPHITTQSGHMPHARLVSFSPRRGMM